MSDTTYVRKPENQCAERTLEQFAALIQKYTMRFFKRSQGLNSPYGMDDIKQELSLVFLRCKDRYNVERGGSFMNYVITAWHHEMNRMFEKDQANLESGYTVRSSAEDEDGDSFSLFDSLASDDATPEQNMECLQSYRSIMNGLSKPAKMLVETILDPPKPVIDEFNRQLKAHSSRAQAFNGPGNARGYRRLGLPFLLNMFDVPETYCVSLTREIKTTVSSIIHPKSKS